MFPIKSSLLKKLYNEDILYHYTKSSTAIDFILFKLQLRFSKVSYSSDPIESKRAKRSTVYFNEEADKNQTKEELEAVKDLHDFVEGYESKFHQICFCKNVFDEKYDSIPYFKNFEEYFGFTKLRMWDQYADKYTGICIAFSKSKILEKNKDKFDLFYDDIKYLTFNEINLKKVGDIQGNYLNKVGKEQYINELKIQINESLFIKHNDYSSENEFRIGTFFNEEKTSFEIIRDEYVFDQSMMLDITDCIKAIFVSSFANEKQKEELMNYANKLNVDLIEIKWKYNSIELIDCKEQLEFYKKIEK